MTSVWYQSRSKGTLFYQAGLRQLRPEIAVQRPVLNRLADVP
jgi:hypothetical protein